MSAILTQINISAGGMPKHAVLLGRVSYAGVEGDRQRNRKLHGGPDRAICIYSEELYAVLQAEGFAVRPGDLGENFTTRGIDLQTLGVGDLLTVGECQIQITKVRVPCRQLTQWAADLPARIVGRSGWMARVLKEGIVRPGDAIEKLAASTP